MINETMARAYLAQGRSGRQSDPAGRIRRTAPHGGGRGGRRAFPGPGRARAPAILPALHASRLAGDERRGPHHQRARARSPRRSRKLWRVSCRTGRSPASRPWKRWSTIRRARGAFPMLLLSVFSVLALVLAAVGIVGVVGHSVAQRTHEIGIRMALGAGTMDVLRLMVNGSMAWVLVGLAVGHGRLGRAHAAAHRNAVRRAAARSRGARRSVVAAGRGGAARQLSAGAAGGENRPDRGAALRLIVRKVKHVCLSVRHLSHPNSFTSDAHVTGKAHGVLRFADRDGGFDPKIRAVKSFAKLLTGALLLLPGCYANTVTVYFTNLPATVENGTYNGFSIATVNGIPNQLLICDDYFDTTYMPSSSNMIYYDSMLTGRTLCNTQCSPLRRRRRMCRSTRRLRSWFTSWHSLAHRQRAIRRPTITTRSGT